MKLINSKSKNILSIGSKSIEIDFNSGITCISGKNGNGKSSLFEAIFFGLTGKSYRGAKKNSLINRTNGKDLEEIIKLIKDGNEYEIGRRIKQSSKLPKEYIKINGIDTDLKDSDFQKEVEKIIGVDEKLLSQLVFLSQDFYVPYIDLDLQEKRKFLSRVFGLEKFKDMEVDIKRDISDIKNKIELTEEKIKGIERTINYAKEQQQKEIVDCEVQIKTYNDDIKEINNKLVEIKNTIQKIDENKLKKYEEDIINLKLENRSLVEKLEVLNNKRYEICSKQNEYKQLYIRIEECVVKLKELNNIKHSFKQFDKIKIIETMEILQQQYDKINNVIEKNIELIMEYKKKIDFYKDNNNCEICGSELSDDFKDKHIEKLNINISEHQKNIEINNIKINNLQIKISKLERITTQIKEQEIKERTNNNEIFNIEKELEYLNKEISSLDIDSMDDVNQKINNYNEKLMINNEKINNIEIIIKEDIIKDIRNKEIQNNVKLYEQKIKLYSENLIKIEKKLNEYINGVNIKNIEDELIENETIYKKMNLKHNYLKQIVDMIGDKGIKQYIVNQYLPILNQYISKFSSLMEFKHKIALTDGGMNIEIKHRGVNIDGALYSSGEKQQINIAILFSFLKLMRMKSGINIPLLMLDEITAPLDLKNTELFYKILKEEFKDICVMVISHKELEKNLEYIDRTIKVEKNIRGFSEYIYEN